VTQPLPTYYSGYVQTLTYEDPIQNFYIFKFKPDTGEDGLPTDKVSVTGNVPGMVLHEGMWLAFEAEWVTHPQYGRQLKITRAPAVKETWSPPEILNLLRNFGIRSFDLDALASSSPPEAFSGTLLSPTALVNQGLSQEVADTVSSTWRRITVYFKTLNFLSTTVNLPANLTATVWSVFGDTAEEVLSSDPWRLIEIPQITFRMADEAALRLGLSLDNPNRIRGAAAHALKERESGHLFQTTQQIFQSVQMNVPDVSPSRLGAALASLIIDGSAVLDKSTRPGTMAVYHPWLYDLEASSAASLRLRMQTATLDPNYGKALTSVGPKTAAAHVSHPNDPHAVANAAIEEWGEQIHLKLSSFQKEGVLNALTQPVSILTGLPGTGKTSALKAAVQILKDASVPYLLCAPTGIAAKRLETVTGSFAYTIHRAFGAQSASSDDGADQTYIGVTGTQNKQTSTPGDDGSWDFGPTNPHPAKVIIVDESSMVDQHLLYRILQCTSPECRIVFVGDAAQLPSVGPGNVLRELITSGLFPTVKLTEIFRQEETSSIVYAAHAIHRGQVPQSGGDFVLVHATSEQAAFETTVRIAEKLYEKRANFQVLSPRHGGTVGVTALNATLRDLLNPKDLGKAEIKIGGDMIREDDRIMVIQNNYKLGVYNGDTGKIASIDRRARIVQVKIHGDKPLLIAVDFNKVSRLLRLAYAVTVHKAQGLEYDIVVVPVVDAFRHQLQRNLYYTAITRAKKKVFLVGTESALKSAVLNAREDDRNTLLGARLRIA